MSSGRVQPEELLLAESAMIKSFKLLREAQSPEVVRASALALLESASQSSELALRSIALSALADEASTKGNREDGNGEDIALMEACQECMNSVIVSYKKMEALALNTSSAGGEGSDDQRSAKERVTSQILFEDMRSQLLSQKRELEEEIKAMKDQMKKNEDLDRSMATQFQTLLRVETPEDRMVVQLMSLYLGSGMVGVNLAFVASGGSLAVSTFTALTIRVVPQLIIYVVKLARQSPI
jgi:hypothetical protein